MTTTSLPPGLDSRITVSRNSPVPGLATRVLFLDDNLVNVEGAREAGFVSFRAQGVAEARAVLITERVLPV